MGCGYRLEWKAVQRSCFCLAFQSLVPLIYPPANPQPHSPCQVPFSPVHSGLDKHPSFLLLKLGMPADKNDRKIQQEFRQIGISSFFFLFFFIVKKCPGRQSIAATKVYWCNYRTYFFFSPLFMSFWLPYSDLLPYGYTGAPYIQASHPYWRLQEEGRTNDFSKWGFSSPS